MKNKGLVHIYTGNGKGKTTAAVGLAVRALSHKLNVCYSVFNKNPKKYGITEIETLKKLGAYCIQITNEHPDFNKLITKKEHTTLSNNGITKLQEIITTQNIDMLIMDEVIISVRDNYISESTLIDFIKNKPFNLELIITGRNASDKLIKLADYVSDIQAIKHPFTSGVSSREGIEY